MTDNFEPKHEAVAMQFTIGKRENMIRSAAEGRPSNFCSGMLSLNQ